MQRLKKTIGISIVIFFITLPAMAQRSGHLNSSRWVSEKGYWVMESNIHTSKTCTFYFYNNDNLLVYTEKVEGGQVNIKKRATLKKLKKVLDNSLLARQDMLKEKEEGSLVRNILKITND